MDGPADYEVILDWAADHLLTNNPEGVFEKAVEGYIEANEQDVVLAMAATPCTAFHHRQKSVGFKSYIRNRVTQEKIQYSS